ncbi:MAG: hypothetical protein KDD70_04760, partial [Bdellovibrionales bacterium]|nr:hypothetical protein [Bdellovibrionales bacterium]
MLWLFPGENSEDATRKGFVTSLLIWVNVLVYILCLLTWLDLQPDGFPNEEELYLKFGYIPGKYNPVTHVTSMFLHAGWFHLLC